VYQTAILLLAAAQQIPQVMPFDYRLPKPPAGASVTPGRCAEARGDEILVCGRREQQRAIATIPPPPGYSPDTRIELFGGTLGPEVSAGYQNGWPDRRVVLKWKKTF
jgi:hypothetical protein